MMRNIDWGNAARRIIAAGGQAALAVLMFAAFVHSLAAQGAGKKRCIAPVGTSALWADFIAARKAGREPVLPDFSYAGYRRSEAPIPTIKGPVFNVTKYGAAPNDEGFDDAGIQAAINAAEAAGGGVVFFPSGRFLVNPTEDEKHFISIKNSRVVLRGSGSDASGTEILMVAKKRNGKMFRIGPDSWGERTVAKVTEPAVRETFWVTVDNPMSLKVGQTIVLRYQSQEYNDFYFDGMPLDKDWTRVVQNGVGIHEMHQIAEINGKRVRFREPLHFSIKLGSTPWRLDEVKPLEEIGVEDIRFSGSWDRYPETFVHHKDWIHDAGWSIISISRTINGWIRRVEFTNFNDALFTDSVGWFTAENIKFTGKKGHSSVGARRGYGLLVKDSEDAAGTHHGPNTGYNVVGAVYLRFKMNVDAAPDNHGGVPHANLLDDVTGGVLSGNGGPLPNYPHTGRYYTLWNFRHRSSSAKTYDFWNPVDRNSNAYAKPIFAGFTFDKPVSFREEASEVQANDSFGRPVTPRSLFESQLRLRTCR